LSQEGFDGPIVASAGLSPRVTIQEFGTRFRVDFAGGHKTGFFCDQRDNRRMLSSFCAGKTVLDLCCYSGGFAIQAKKLGQAAEVTGVDLDEEPLALGRARRGNAQALRPQSDRHAARRPRWSDADLHVCRLAFAG
jgi:23S rRNA (cytosine1962-C5)-methyltransferase